MESIFVAMFALMLLTFVVWVYMFAKRIPLIQASNFTPEQPQEFGP